jgi:hypothetical protein
MVRKEGKESALVCKCGEEFNTEQELNGHKRYQNHRDSDV